MSLTRSEREHLIQQYADGPARLEGALARVPAEARKWRPAPGEWSAHEVACHCADSETNGAARIRYVVCEPEPVVLGYDENVWAVALDYHAHPVDVALATVRAVRANTVAVLRRLPEEAGCEKDVTPRRVATPRWTGSPSTPSIWRSTPGRSRPTWPRGRPPAGPSSLSG